MKKVFCLLLALTPLPAAAEISTKPAPVWFLDSSIGYSLKTFPACSHKIVGHIGYIGQFVSDTGNEVQTPERIFRAVTCFEGQHGALGWVVTTP